MINDLDGWLYGEYPPDTKGLHYYWENLYHQDDTLTKTSDAYRTYFYSFARIATRLLSRGRKGSCQLKRNGPIKEVSYLNQHDHLAGLLVLYDVEFMTEHGRKETITVESWVSMEPKEELMNLNMTKGPQRLVSLDVSVA